MNRCTYGRTRAKPGCGKEAPHTFVEIGAASDYTETVSYCDEHWWGRNIAEAVNALERFTYEDEAVSAAAIAALNQRLMDEQGWALVKTGDAHKGAT